MPPIRTASIPSPTLDLADLRARLRGSVIAPADAGYDEARALFYGGLDLRPAAIVRVADAADVATVIAVARDTGLELAVRSGGHSVAGHSSTDGGPVVDLRGLRDVELDPESRTVWAGSGLTAAELTKATGQHGLAVGFGDTGSVGIGGITLGGGVGYLARKHGLTIDSLLAAEVVTADGQVRVVDEEHEPDLFWAIRGGGGNFGVATRFRFRLVPVDPFVGGFLILPATPATIAAFVAAAEAAPDELTGIGNVMPAPPMPFLAEEHHGRLVIFAILAFLGDDEAGARALAPFRAIAEPLADLVAPSAYADIYGPDGEDYHPTAVARTMFIDHVDEAVAATIVQHLEASDAPMRVAQLRVLGGAVASVPADATAYAHRASRIMVNLAAFFSTDDERVARERWLADFARAIDQGDPAAYVNFLYDEGPERIRAAYPGATWDRLVAVKRRYDPDNLFRRNQNIPPAPA